MDSHVARLQARADGFLFQSFLVKIYTESHFSFQIVFLTLKLRNRPIFPFNLSIRFSNAVGFLKGAKREYLTPDTHAFSVLYPARRLRRGAVQEAPPVKRDGRNSRIGSKRRRRSYRDTPGSPQSAVNRETKETASGKQTDNRFLFHNFRVVSRAFGGTAPNSRAFRVNSKRDHAQQNQHS